MLLYERPLENSRMASALHFSPARQKKWTMLRRLNIVYSRLLFRRAELVQIRRRLRVGIHATRTITLLQYQLGQASLLTRMLMKADTVIIVPCWLASWTGVAGCMLRSSKSNRFAISPAWLSLSLCLDAMVPR